MVTGLALHRVEAARALASGVSQLPLWEPLVSAATLTTLTCCSVILSPEGQQGSMVGFLVQVPAEPASSR